MKNITDLFFEAAGNYPENIAIIEAKKNISYRELAREVRITAAYFKSKGIQRGDRVLIFVPMSIDLYRIVLAIFSMGATAVFLDEWVSRKRMDLCCSIADCKAFIAVPKIKLFSFISKELRKIPIKLSTKFSGKSESDVEDLDLNESALITFTTGSTGIPKAANRSHQFLYEQFKALNDEIQPKAFDVDITLLPIVLFMNLGTGATSIIYKFNQKRPEQADLKKLVKLIKEKNVNRMTSSPFLLLNLAKEIINREEKYLGLEKIFTGGAPVFPKDALLLKQAFLNAEVKIVYGSTEAEPISCALAEDVTECEPELSKLGLFVGNVYKDTNLKIINIIDDLIPDLSEDQLKEIERQHNQIGEIIVSGPHVLDSYYNNDEAFKRNKFKSKDILWHRTGDSGRIDTKGKLWLTGRSSSLIRLKDQYISPFIYENILSEIDNIVLATILELNEKIIVACEVKTNSDKKQIKEEIKKLDISWDDIQFVKKIPRDPRHHSKINYQLLKTIIINS